MNCRERTAYIPFPEISARWWCWRTAAHTHKFTTEAPSQECALAGDLIVSWRRKDVVIWVLSMGQQSRESEPASVRELRYGYGMQAKEDEDPHGY